MATFLNTLGDIGYGVMDASNAAQNMYQNIDKTNLSSMGVDRAQQQFDADTAADIFNAGAQAAAAKSNAARQEAILARAKAQDAFVPYDPEMQSVIGEMAMRHGGANTPEFRQELADYYAGQGRLNYANPMYKAAQIEITAGQQVAATVRQIPGFEDVDTVERGPDGIVRGYAGGQEVQLPRGATEQFAALTGNPDPLKYSKEALQAAQNNRRLELTDLATQIKGRAGAGVADKGTEAARIKAATDAQHTLQKTMSEMVKTLVASGMPVNDAATAATKEVFRRADLGLLVIPGYTPKGPGAPAPAFVPGSAASRFAAPMAAAPAAPRVQSNAAPVNTGGVTGTWGAPSSLYDAPSYTPQ